MKILVLATDYPDDKGGLNLAYIRTRNVLYHENGENITVINFSTDHSYMIDGIEVLSFCDFKKRHNFDFDLLIFHAPNLRNHYLFLIKYGKFFKKKVFFFHGHEVLKLNEVYSTPFPYVRRNKIKEKFQDVYDNIKFKFWRNYFNNNYASSYFIFVSNWMKDEFLKWIAPKSHVLENRNFITYNCIGKFFEDNTYDSSSVKKYDFVTIRANLDGSKYCVDIVNDLAWENPDLKFLVVGKGEFFNHYKKAPNLYWISKRLNHSEMKDILNSSRIALMPTRTDAQGVMMCEMAAFGMPLITSDIPVCHEVFNNYPGVAFIDNTDYKNIDIKNMSSKISGTAIKDNRYFNSKVGIEELEILRIINSNL